MKHLFLAAVAVAALTSCAQSELENTIELSNEPIKLTVGAKGMITAGTRTPYVGAIGASNTLTAIVVPNASLTSFAGPTLYSDVTTTNFSTYTMTWLADDGSGSQNTSLNDINAVGFSTPLFYPSNPATLVYMSGLYPTTGWTLSSGVFSKTIDGQTDIMYATTVNTTKPDAALDPNTSFPTLVFKHALTLLDIKVVAEDEAAKTVWGNITNMQVTKTLTATPNTTIGITFPATAVGYKPTLTGAAPGTLTNVYRMTAEDVYNNNLVSASNITVPFPAANAEWAAYSMVPPIDATHNSATGGYSITVSTVNRTGGVEVPITLLFTDPANQSGTVYTGGMKFTVTLTFKGQEIRATATVTEWASAGTATGEVI